MSCSANRSSGRGPPARRPCPDNVAGTSGHAGASRSASAHGDALYEGISGEGGDRLWQYLFEGPFADRAAFDLHLQRIAASEDPMFFAILDNASGRRWDTPPTCESSPSTG